MKFSRFLILLTVVLAAVPLWAQGRSIDISGFATWVDPTGSNTVRFDQDEQEIDVDFDSEQGWGVAVNVFWSNRISTEFAASVVEPELSLRASDPQFPFFAARDLEMLPITAVMQFHLAPDSSFDPYIGAGAAYVLFDDVEGGADLDEIDVDQIDLDDDVGLAVNAGLTWSFTPALGLYLDAKYVPVEWSARAVFTQGPQEQDIEINPFIVAAGLTFKF